MECVHCKNSIGVMREHVSTQHLCGPNLCEVPYDLVWMLSKVLGYIFITLPPAPSLVPRLCRNEATNPSFPHPCPSESFEMTFPSTSRDRLMKVPSLKRIPSAPVALTLSEPARSTRFWKGGNRDGKSRHVCMYIL